MSAPGIGIAENLALTAPRTSLANARVYLVIHCLPAELIAVYDNLSNGTFEKSLTTFEAMIGSLASLFKVYSK